MKRTSFRLLSWSCCALGFASLFVDENSSLFSAVAAFSANSAGAFISKNQLFLKPERHIKSPTFQNFIVHHGISLSMSSSLENEKEEGNEKNSKDALSNANVKVGNGFVDIANYGMGNGFSTKELNSEESNDVLGGNVGTGGEYSYSTVLVKRRARTQRRTMRQRLTNRILNKNKERQTPSGSRSSSDTKLTSSSSSYSHGTNGGGKKRKLNLRISRLLSSFATSSLDLSDDDGYAGLMFKNRPLYRRMMRAPFKLAKTILFPDLGKEPGTLILVRHGESLWNYNKTFTGWADPDLSERGEREVEHAARLLVEGGYEVDVVFTSRLKRAIRSVWMILQELDKAYLPVFKSWRLNERMYGALTGLSKTETASQLGEELVQSWRGSLHARPPPLEASDAYWPGRDRKHFDLSPKQIPLTESLLDCMQRTRPVWEDKITYELRKGQNVLVVAHANTIRGLVKIIDDIGDDEIQEVSIPTGIPIVYKFEDVKSLIPVSSNHNAAHSAGGKAIVSQKHMNGIFLEKPGLLKEALEREEEWRKRVPGYESAMEKQRPMTSLERSLFKLRAERELGHWAGKIVEANGRPTMDEDDGSDGNNGKPVKFIQHHENDYEPWDDDFRFFEEDEAWSEFIPGSSIQVVTNGSNSKTYASSSSSSLTPSIQSSLSSSTSLRSSERNAESSPHASNGDNATRQNLKPKILILDEDDVGEEQSPALISANPCQKPLPTETVLPGMGNVPIRTDAVIVMIRHGKTEHNKLGLFTGWEDAPLAPEGVKEAKEAGQLLKAHGFEFDLVYTSWLTRAIETAWLVIDELDCLWLPIIKTWRLNERMYGDLTGLSKRMVRQRHGDTQFKAWRRGYRVRPPPVSSFSTNYPGNDQRYLKFMKDVRYSLGETIIRSIERRRIHLHRKFPKSESLKDCMERTIPYFSHQIVPEAINMGKRVLIASSENAIRGLLMHLCEIPEEKIVELEIPNGLPLIFDVKSKCVKLLDDGTGRDPLEVYNFGNAASYLFRPCMNEDGSPDEECDIRFMSDDFEQSESDRETVDLLKNKMLRFRKGEEIRL